MVQTFFLYLQSMKKLLPILFLVITFKVYSQKVIREEEVTDHSMHVIGNDFEGIIFRENYHQRSGDTAELRIKKFTPSQEDVYAAEVFLRDQIKDKINQGDKKYIFSNLKKYRRQYLGYLNDKGEKIVYINCFPVDLDWADKKIKNEKQVNITTWYDSLFYVFDGGKSFWQIHINITKKKIISMSVNGLA